MTLIQQKRINIQTPFPFTAVFIYSQQVIIQETPTLADVHALIPLISVNAVHFATISIDQCPAGWKELQPNQFTILVKVQKHFWAPIVLNQRAQRNVLRDRAWDALSRMCRKVQIGNVIISPCLQSYLRLDHA